MVGKIKRGWMAGGGGGVLVQLALLWQLHQAGATNQHRLQLLQLHSSCSSEMALLHVLLCTRKRKYQKWLQPIKGEIGCLPALVLGSCQPAACSKSLLASRERWRCQTSSASASAVSARLQACCCCPSLTINFPRTRQTHFASYWLEAFLLWTL